MRNVCFYSTKIANSLQNRKQWHTLCIW
jgi:hypothetical protein